MQARFNFTQAAPGAYKAMLMWTGRIPAPSDEVAHFADQRLCLLSGHALERFARNGRE